MSLARGGLGGLAILSKLRRKSAAGDFKLVHDLALLWVGQLLSRIVVFAGFAYLARVLQPQAYGAVEFSLALATLGSVIIEAGFGSIGVRRVARGEASLADVAALIPATRLAFACIVAPILWLIALLAARDSMTVALAGWIAVSMLILPFKQDWLFQSQERMGHILVSQLLRAGVFAGGVVLLVHGDSRAVLVGAVEIASVVIAAAYLLLVQARSIAPVRLDLRAFRMLGLAREGLFVGLLAMMWPINQYAPLLMLGSMQGMTETAHFAAAHRLVMALVVFAHLYHFNLYPMFARAVRDETSPVDTLARASVRITAWGGIGAALGACLLAQPVMTLLFGAPFANGAPAFAILIWVFPIALLSGHTRWMMVAAGREHDMVMAELVGAAVLVVAAPLLIIRFGGAGAATAMVVSTLAVWIAAQVRSALRSGGAPWRPCIIPATAAGLVLLIVRLSEVGAFWGIALAMSLFAAAMLAFDRAVLPDLARLVTGKGKRT